MEAALDARTAERFARLALDCVHREYPSHVVMYLTGDEDVRPPRRNWPAFHGCYDWHSAVHGHWLLARLARLFPAEAFAKEALAALERSLTPDNVAGEVAYLELPGRAGFEMPYGIAWLLALAAELRELRDPSLHTALLPLEGLCAQRFGTWAAKLPRPIRVGTHGQSAFAMGLALDYARRAGDHPLAATIEQRAHAFHDPDRHLGLHLEPSAYDFLSPALGVADLMRRVLPAHELAAWLTRAIPEISRDGGEWLAPVHSPDPTDAKLVHLDGLHLSRAWMMEAIADALPRDDPRVPSLLSAARVHRGLGLAAVRPDHYVGAHWLGTYAVYLLTRRRT